MWQGYLNCKWARGGHFVWSPLDSFRWTQEGFASTADLHLFSMPFIHFLCCLFFFLSPPFHQIPSSLMFKIISFLQHLLAGQGCGWGMGWIDWKCVNTSHGVRGQYCCWPIHHFNHFVMNQNSQEKNIIKMQKSKTNQNILLAVGSVPVSAAQTCKNTHAGRVQQY